MWSKPFPVLVVRTMLKLRSDRLKRELEIVTPRARHTKKSNRHSSPRRKTSIKVRFYPEIPARIRDNDNVSGAGSVKRRILHVGQASGTEPPSRREMANQELTAAIQTTFTKSRGTYGSPRIHAELKSTGMVCSLNRVARLMRKEGIQARRRKQYKITTTNSRHSHPIAPNTLNRQFWAEGPNQKWVGDITYIATKEGWLYFAAILDIYSRKVIGWSMDKHMEQELVASALQMATAQRRPGTGVLHHTDRGSQYAANDYQKLLNSHKMTVSMSRKGDCYDNSMMESFFRR